MENTVLKKKTRNSSFEILRLAAMLMIIVSHIYAFKRIFSYKIQ